MLANENSFSTEKLPGCEILGYTHAAFMGDVVAQYRFALKVLMEISVTIAVPAIAAAFVGKFLDAYFQTGHTFFVLLLFLAFVMTSVVLVKKIRQYVETYKQLIYR